MPRDPLPPVGWSMNCDLGERLEEALDLNYSIHDGAIIFERREPTKYPICNGWSYRLYPPEVAAQITPNKGSAFNSALAMSCVSGMEAVLTWSDDRILKFNSGRIDEIQLSSK